MDIETAAALLTLAPVALTSGTYAGRVIRIHEVKACPKVTAATKGRVIGSALATDELDEEIGYLVDVCADGTLVVVAKVD